MPLYELEEGTSRKFYRVELVGRRVELSWGRIGSAAKRKVVECESEMAAQRRFDEEVFRRRERGYRLVLDETKPHDPEAARAKANADKLASGAPLTKNPRFRFVDSKRQTFVWLEVRGADLLRAEGKCGQEAAAQPRSSAFRSATEATRERDRMTATLLAEGFQLDAFGRR